ncbi:Sodium dicarboxylate symporter [Cryptosporidium tyzzeri]|nr:Sodium dicarboxylate symporter [Cryptosporidium tyzzeri]
MAIISHFPGQIYWACVYFEGSFNLQFGIVKQCLEESFYSFR